MLLFRLLQTVSCFSSPSPVGTEQQDPPSHGFPNESCLKSTGETKVAMERRQLPTCPKSQKEFELVVDQENFEFCDAPCAHEQLSSSWSESLQQTFLFSQSVGAEAVASSSQVTAQSRWPFHPLSLPLRLNAERPPSATWRAWVTSAASTQLKHLFSDVVLPNLPVSIKESWIESQKCFAKVCVKNAAPLMNGTTFR